MIEDKKELTLSDIDNKLNEVLEYLKVLCPDYEEQKRKDEEEKAKKKKQEEYLKYLKTNYINVNIPIYSKIIKVTKYTLITFLNNHLRPIHYYQLKNL